MLARSVVGSTLHRGQRKQPPMRSPHPTGVCTLGSFLLPSVEHKRQPMCSPHANVQLVVSLYQAQNTNASLRALYLTNVCTPGSFPLSGAKYKLQPRGG